LHRLDRGERFWRPVRDERPLARADLPLLPLLPARPDRRHRNHGHEALGPGRRADTTHKQDHSPAMTKVFNVAVVGGGIGRSHIVEGYVPNADKFRVAAICDINTEKLNALGDEFDVDRRVESFDELLAM